MTKANANMGDGHASEKYNNSQQKRSVTTPAGPSAGGPTMVNKKEPTNSGSV